MRDKAPRGKTTEKYAINEEITAREVRLIGADGDQLGVVSREDALKRADDEGIDLVEVAPEASPPVCRLLDYGKLKYKEQKKAAETRKRSSSHTIKEIRVRYSTDKHDLETKLRKARQFLEGGDRVKFQMRFRGREVVYKELGEEIFRQIAEALEEFGAIEDFSPLMGHRMIMTIVPKNMTKS